MAIYALLQPSHRNLRMNRVLVWDLPTRVFHWLFAAGFIAAATIALLLGDDSPLFPYHAMIGLTLAALLAWRLLWGLVGSRHARFRSFAHGPIAVAGYLRSELVGPGQRHGGHNPGSAWAIFAMLGLMAILAATGVMLGLGNEGVKEFHELCAYAMVALVAIHLLGVAIHTIRHRENITASMIHGRKQAASNEAIASPRPIAAAILLAIVIAWGVGLVRNYQPSTESTTLPMLGVSLRLGEVEHEQPREQHHERGRHADDGDDD